MNFQLRPYQDNAINLLRDGIRKGHKRQVLYLATGAGKTRLAAAIISSIVERGKRVAFICNRIELVTQASSELTKHGISHGIIQGQNSWKTDSAVVVCSIQTLARRGYPEVDFLIVDECHACAGSQAYRDLFKTYNNLSVVGLSATPFSKGLGKHYPEMYGPMFDSIVVAATIPELIEGGFLVDCDIYAPSEPDLTGVKIVAGDYNEEQLGEAVDKPKLVGDIVSHYLRLTPGKRAICFATNINHSKHIVASFVASGIDARHIDAYTPDEERVQLIKQFKAGEFPILSNCSLLAEGFDCPETEVIILARPTRSLIRYIQMSGRALRIHDNLSEHYRLYRRMRDGIQGSHALEVGQLSREYGCCSSGVAMRSGQEIDVQALEQSKRNVFSKEGACLSAEDKPREGKAWSDELFDRDNQGCELQCSSLSGDGLGGEQRVKATGESQGWKQAEQSRRQFGVGDESGKHKARILAWIVPGAQWRKAREKQTDECASGSNKNGTEGLSSWVIDETGTKVRSADNNYIGDQGWQVLGACFIADRNETTENLANRLLDIHTGKEALLVCYESEYTGNAVRISGVKPPKEKAIILDHSGTVKILGFPTDELPLELDDGKPKASKPKENLPKVCPSCAFVYKKGTKKCPCCGFEPVAKPGDVEVEDGELKKLERKKVFTHAEKQDIYSALYAVQTKKGYKPGWVSNNYRDIVGVWPKGQIDKPGDMIPLVENHLLYKAIKWANSPENKSVFRGSRNPHECPTCHKVGNYYKTEAKGPHGPGAKCVCGTHWWLPKGEA